MNYFNTVGVIVLAAGEGKRMKLKKNKVLSNLEGYPLIWHTLDHIQKAGLDNIILVVGYDGESVKKRLGPKYTYALQPVRLGTAQAVKVGLAKVLPGTGWLLVLNGDDSAFYPPKILKEFVKRHIRGNFDLSVLTVRKDNPTGLGRVERDAKGNLTGIVEEKNANVRQLAIKEVSTGCFCFSVKFLKHFLPKVRKNPITGEYYLPDLVAIAPNKKKINAWKMDNQNWFHSINTPGQLAEAQQFARRNAKI